MRQFFFLCVLTMGLPLCADECRATDWLNDLQTSCSSRSDACQPDDTGCCGTSFIDRLFNFRPWTAADQRSADRPVGLPIGRRYFGGRYFGQFSNRFYGPQYGNF